MEIKGSFVKIILILLILVSCGKIKTDNEVKAGISGETYSYIVLKFGFLDQIKALCVDIYPDYEYLDEKERTKLISQCTLDKMSILNLDALNKFNDNICTEPKTAKEAEICTVINGSSLL
jgi:hypothetical protein